MTKVYHHIQYINYLIAELERNLKKKLEIVYPTRTKNSLKLSKSGVVAPLQRQQGDQVQVFKFSLDDTVKVPPTTTK